VFLRILQILTKQFLFSANPSGGSGTYYYIWSGACNGYNQNCDNSFSQSGSYLAHITVHSGGQTASAGCSVQVNEQECSCSCWTDWQDQGCGQDSCASTQMYQIRSRDCAPDGCNTELETRCVSDQSCEPSCTDDCSYYGQRTCSGDFSYKTCGNYDSDTCLEWSGSTNCPSGQECSGGQCVDSCTTHDYQQCYDDDVYGMTPVNDREDKFDECGSDVWTDNYQCSGDWVQRQKTLKGCSGSSCFENTQWFNQINCA